MYRFGRLETVSSYFFYGFRVRVALPFHTRSVLRLSPDLMSPSLYTMRYRASQGKATVSSKGLTNNAVSKASEANGGAAAPMVSGKIKGAAAKPSSEEASDDSESEDDSEDDSESEDESESKEESEKKASKPPVSNEGWGVGVTPYGSIEKNRTSISLLRYAFSVYFGRSETVSYLLMFFACEKKGYRLEAYHTFPTLVPSSLSPTLIPSSLSPTLIPSSLSPTLIPSSLSPTLIPSSLSPTLISSGLSPKRDCRHRGVKYEMVRTLLCTTMCGG